MAGRVLRDSRGRYAGSTRGWGKGRTTHGGGFGSGRKGKTKVVGRPSRTMAVIKHGGSAGIGLGAGVVGAAMIVAGSKRGNLGLVAAGGAVNVAGQFAMAKAGASAIRSAVTISKKTIKR